MITELSELGPERSLLPREQEPAWLQVETLRTLDLTLAFQEGVSLVSRMVGRCRDGFSCEKMNLKVLPHPAHSAMGHSLFNHWCRERLVSLPCKKVGITQGQNTRYSPSPPPPRPPQSKSSTEGLKKIEKDSCCILGYWSPVLHGHHPWPIDGFVTDMGSKAVVKAEGLNSSQEARASLPCASVTSGF